MPLKFPTIQDVAWELRALNASLDRETTVRFEILTDGRWWIHAGDSKNDIDGHSYGSSGKVPGCTGKHHKPRKFPSEELAKHLIDEAADEYFQDKE